MTLKEELEIIRGASIDLRIRPEEVPCIETSDSEELCKNPTVSVRMLTYNHEPYIRQAIESIVRQKTDFEFELVIGEDASTDKTRDICFEMQKKYPDKIRVLWSDENLYKVGGNSVRTLAKCRGEFHAYCEGDDYWVDEYKLQKQVAIMRKHPNVVVCFGEQQNLDQATGRITQTWSFKRRWPTEGVILRAKFATTDCLVAPFTALIRMSALRSAHKRFDIFSWALHLGDLTLWRALSQFGDFYFSHDIYATYRNHAGGVTKFMPTKVGIDAGIVRMYFAKKNEDSSMSFLLAGMRSAIRNRFYDIAKTSGLRNRRRMVQKINSQRITRDATTYFAGPVAVLIAMLGCEWILRRYFKVVDKVNGCLLK